MSIEMLQFEHLQKLIIEIRNQRVLLDSDVATIYGIETKRVNEAVKNNPDKFPDGYIIALDKNEWEAIMKSKFSTSLLTAGGKTKLPKAFTEKGLYMLATILKSKQAVEATFLIIETFSKLRALSRNIHELPAVKDEPTQKLLMQKSGELIADLFDEGLQKSNSETSIELNFAILKVKHTIKKQRK